MGICASCLGQRRESTDAETARLLDDELYHGYGYGATGSGRIPIQDIETLRREREALDAICQRTSDSVVDIWAIHPHPYTPPRVPSDDHNFDRVSQLGSPLLEDEPRPGSRPSLQSKETISDGGEFGGMKYVTLRSPPPLKLSTVPKQWGEVIMTTKPSMKTRPGGGRRNHSKKHGRRDNDVFDVLVVN